MRNDKLELYSLKPSKLGPSYFLYFLFLHLPLMCMPLEHTENVRNVFRSERWVCVFKGAVSVCVPIFYLA